MLTNLSATQAGQKDIHALGLVMMQLMELGTSLQNPESLILQHPEKWDQGIRRFLERTALSSCEDLEKVMPRNFRQTMPNLLI